jgi:tRNA (cmo5U34)-methyltransferase
MKIRELFDQCATEYDRDRPKLVPCFDEFYGTAMRVIPFSRDAEISVLDLGSGTGLFAAMVAKAFPSARLHLTDISEAMLAQAAARFAGNPLVTCSIQNHVELAADSAYDLVLSALSIHHLEHPDKQTVFQRIYRALRPGGMFINVDQALAPSAKGEDEYEQLWLADAKTNGISEPALHQARERMREDKNALLLDQLLWLTQAGFEDVDCWYKRFRFVVYGGTKRETTSQE